MQQTARRFVEYEPLFFTLVPETPRVNGRNQRLNMHLRITGNAVHGGGFSL